MNDVWGYISAALIGISLGLIGGGGSILTVPVLVYLFGLSPLTATSYSLFVVGSTSLVGAASHYRRKLVHLPAAFLFGTASVATVFAVRKFILPRIPSTITVFRGIPVTLSFLTMFLFSLLMLAAAVFMLRKQPAKTHGPHPKPVLILSGIGIGLLTGFLGAGGGFLLIPALVLLLKVEMKKAVGTSLLIIAANSLIGFLGDVGHVAVNWHFLLLITAIAITGIFIGTGIGRQAKGPALKKGFSWFILAMAVYILITELSNFFV